MSLFTSTREKRLWGWASIVLATIYSTLGLARTLVGLIPDRNIVDNLFMFGLLLVVASILTIGIGSKRNMLQIGIGLGVLAIYLLVFLRMAIPEERSHLVEYGILSLFVFEALKERKKNGGRVPRPALVAILIGAMAGVLDECIQVFIPSRVFDPFDILFNLLAAIMAVSAASAMDWARHRSQSK